MYINITEVPILKYLGLSPNPTLIPVFCLPQEAIAMAQLVESLSPR